MAIYVLEFGGQHTDLIGNRMEEMGFPVKYAPSDVKISDLDDADGIILSGGPKSIQDNDAYAFDPTIFHSRTPLLGICYGMQLLGRHLGADIHRRTREYGETLFYPREFDELLTGLSPKEIVWMNHGDSINEWGIFTVTGYTQKNVPASIASIQYPHFGVQFHPEVTHTEHGKIILRNFAERICGMRPQARREEMFDAGKFIDEAVYRLKQEVGTGIVVVYTSGGVDSTTAAMLAKIAGLKMQPVYLEMGNGRKNEARYVQEALSKLLGDNVYVHDRRDYFIGNVAELPDPEVKRKKFARLYSDTRGEIDRMFGLDRGEAFLIQGTIATDRRESGREAGKYGQEDKGTVDSIKTHHNVGAEATLGQGNILPLAELTKDRVRIVARELNIPSEISERSPFPGLGMYVRFVTGLYLPDRHMVTEVSQITSAYGMHGYVLPRKSVGLKGDSRVFEHAALITGQRNWTSARKISKALIEDLDICRVLFLPYPVAFEQEALDASANYTAREGITRLQEVTDVVETAMDEFGVVSAQTSVIAFGGAGGWLNVIRDVDSVDFRTCRPLRKPDEFPWECYDYIERRLRERLGKDAGVTTFDVSDKPGGTTEWE